MANKMTQEELIKGSKNMDPAELVEKLNEDAANFIEQLPKADKNNTLTLEEWDEQIKTHPLFMTKPPAEGEEMPPLLEALQNLKYDPEENSPDELARSYKDDGNENFKNKKYRWAVDSYTEGLKANCSDKELLVQLYSNRAAAHYHIGNYEKALKDALAAKSIKPDHIKALERGALCCFQLNNFPDCMCWCEEGLKLFPENKSLADLKQKAIQKKKSSDRDRRKAQAENAKREKELESVHKVISERKIQLADNNLAHDSPSARPDVKTSVHLSEDNRLIWPVMLLYPEYGTTDFIQNFHEDSIFIDHFNVMFGNEPPHWDKEKIYIPENLQVYYMNGEYIINVNSEITLREALSHERYVVYDGTPCFIVTVKDSSFDKDFRAKHILI